MAMASMGSRCPTALFCSLAVTGSMAWAQERTPLPRYTGERVIVAGVRDDFQDVRSQIARLEKSSPQSYYVVIVKTAGPGRSAAVSYVDDLRDAWRAQAGGSGRAYDPDRSVLIAVAVDTHQVALLAGPTLHRRFGLDAKTIQRALIPTFIDRAKTGDYHQAISALLNETNNWIAKQDDETAYAPVQVESSRPAVSTRATPKPAASKAAQPPAKATTTTVTPAPSEPTSVATSERGSTAAAPLQPVKQETAAWWAVLALWIPIAALGVAVMAWVWIMHRRAQSRVAGRLKEIKSKAVDVMDRLDGLKERLKLLPGAPGFSAQPMTGETKTRYDATNQQLGGLWDGWLHVMEVLDKAQKLAARAGSPLSQKTLGEAEELINKQGSFEEIEKHAQGISAALDQIEHAHEGARDVAAAIAGKRQQIDAGLADVAKASLPQAPYLDELASITAATAQARAQLAADPLGTTVVLEQLQARAEGLAVRIGRVVALAAEAQKLKSSLDALTRQAASHRAQGLRLVEEGGNPDPAIGLAEKAHAAGMSQLRAGDPDAAGHELDAAKSALADAQATIDKVQKARASCERELVARGRETERLRTAMTQAENYQSDLERGFAPTSWQTVGHNLEQARSLLATFDRQAQQAAESAAATRQEYLKGAAQFEELARQQQIVLRLMSGLGEQLSALMGIRAECQKLSGELAGRDRQAELAIRQNESVVSDLARQSLENARRLNQEFVTRSGSPRPDWPALRQTLAEAAEDFAIAQSQAEEDVRNYQALTQEFEQVRASASRVYALLASHEEDRLAANQHYQAAADALDRVAAELSEPRGRAAALLEQVRGAAGDLQTSEELAREDIRLAAQAQSEIGEAVGAIRQAQSYGASGLMVNTRGAEAQVDQAQQLLQSQNYEQSIRCAGSAMQTARQIYYEAMQQIQFERMRASIEARRRAVQMRVPPWNGVSLGAAAATAAAAAILERSAQAADQTGPAAAGGSWTEEVAGPISDDAAGGSW